MQMLTSLRTLFVLEKDMKMARALNAVLRQLQISVCNDVFTKVDYRWY